MDDAKILGILAALGSSASWALGSILFARLTVHLTPVALTFAKGVVSVLLLSAVLLASYPGPIPLPALNLLIVSGILGIAVGDVLFFAALQRLGASVVVLLFTLGQALTVVLAVIWLQERPSPMQWLGIAIITLGVSAVLWIKREPDNSRTQMVGILYGLASIVSMSVSVIIAKEALPVVDTLDATFIRMLAGVVGIGLWAALTGQFKSGLTPLLDRTLVMRLTVAVAVVTFGGFWLSLVAVKHIDVTVANTLNSTEPVFVLPLAALFLREKITSSLVLCSVVTVAGIALLSMHS